MKDIFVPKSKQLSVMAEGNEHLVMIYLRRTDQPIVRDRAYKFIFINDLLTVKPLEEVDLIVFRKTNIGYQVIINKNMSVCLHFNDVYGDILIGDQFKDISKNILPSNKDRCSCGQKPGLSGWKMKLRRSSGLLKKENEGFCLIMTRAVLKRSILFQYE